MTKLQQLLDELKELKRFDDYVHEDGYSAPRECSEGCIIRFDNLDELITKYQEMTPIYKTDQRVVVTKSKYSHGFTIDEDDSMFGKLNICKSTYARIMDLDIFIPRMIFIVNNK